MKEKEKLKIGVIFEREIRFLERNSDNIYVSTFIETLKDIEKQIMEIRE